MVGYSKNELSKNARLLHVLAVVVTSLNILGAVFGALAAAFYVTRLGGETAAAVGVFLVCLAVGALVAFLLVAPLHLLIETSLGIAAIEENTRTTMELTASCVRLATEQHGRAQQAA